MMAKDSKELFQTLLQQIKLSPSEEEAEYLDHGEIKSVNVYRNEKKWEFHLSFEEILPYVLFKKFEEALEIAFSKIATIDLNVEVNEPTINQQLISDYWLYTCQHSGVDSPICNQLFKSSTPIFNENKVIFYIEHEVTLSKFNEKFFPPIIEQYKKIGFPSDLRIIPEVDVNAAEEVTRVVKEKNESENAILTKKLTEKHQQNEQNGNTGGSVSTNGPIKLGRSISKNTPIMQMKDIVDEERSVVVEGYVFDVEIRKLRSERELMILKITDYSSSLTVKKFSNNEVDEAIFANIKPGMWLKAQGSIQEDTYTNELGMMAQSLQETFHESRKDKAPEGEKRIELHAHSNMSMMDSTVNVTDLVKTAAKWGHEAVAITDHAGVYSFPDAYQASKENDIQVIYGLEADLVNDGVPIALNASDIELN